MWIHNMVRFILLVVFIFFMAYPMFFVVFALISGCSSQEIRLDVVLSRPSLSFLLGTNEVGQDVACLIGHGLLTSIKISLISTLICFFVGGLLGITSGYFGGILDLLVSRTVEFFQGLPSLIFVIFIVSTLGGGDDKIIISLSAFGWVSFARIARNETIRIRGLEFIRSAYLLGLPHRRVIRRYILPFVLPSLLTQAMFSFSAFALAEGGLGFLGLRPADKVSLGSTIADGIDFILTEPRLVVFPGLALTSVAVVLNIFGQKLISKQKGFIE